MILSDLEIMDLVKRNKLKITPLTEEQIQPASIDVRLSDSYSLMRDSSNGIIELDDTIDYEEIKADKYLLLPGQFVLASSMEYFELPLDVTAFVEGRSSYGRLGLFIQNAGWVDPGFKGELTLELFNASRRAINLIAGKRIGQLVFARTGREASKPYAGKYLGQKGATGSRVFLDSR